jgi:glutamate-1-semialdehyde 2,1-aminomutase
VQAVGSLFWVVLDEDTRRSAPVRSIAAIPPGQRTRFASLFHALLERGVYLAPSGFEVGFFSTAHTDADVEQFVAAFDGALAALQKQ